MSGSNTTPKRKSFGFDSILSILDGKKARPPARPALPPSPEPEIQAAPEVETPQAQQQPPKVIALPEDHTLVPKLLSDIDQKNAEIIKLNNDVVTLRYELREKEFMLNSLTLDNANKELRIKELQAAIDDLKAEIATLKAIRPQQPVVFTPAQERQPPVASEPASPEPEAPQIPLQITQIMEAVQSAKTAQQPPAQPETSAPAPAQVQADAAGTRAISEQYNLKEDVVEEDVATIFKRLAMAHDEAPAEGDNVIEAPRRPRSAKLYDL
ncbi:hypothetical protein [Methanocella arvoryzae]|uniref:Uncharacterized protein n=1 Tax=Methanocella arvoryzae (strain DSM 22066 / NBRC 105507 / MRE50) TaxID=351160 RepID=Q0W5Q8_METAR|nr:hypothetical protein [Methanocella arvoryzae]CAJ36285.1 hypothetical protein RCIX940 [Methanocella arvoryzae MRE50]